MYFIRHNILNRAITAISEHLQGPNVLHGQLFALSGLHNVSPRFSACIYLFIFVYLFPRLHLPSVLLSLLTSLQSSEITWPSPALSFPWFYAFIRFPLLFFFWHRTVFFCFLPALLPLKSARCDAAGWPRCLFASLPVSLSEAFRLSEALLLPSSAEKKKRKIAGGARAKSSVRKLAKRSSCNLFPSLSTYITAITPPQAHQKMS